MADHQFNIKLGINVEKGNSEKQLENVKKSLEKKKVTLKLKLDLDKPNQQLNTFKDSLKDINKKLNDAFKLNNGALDNLKNLKTVLEEINKLSKKTQVKITNSNDADTITKNLETQKQKYAELMRLKQSLEKQRAKTTNAESYNALTREIDLVSQKAEECKTKLSELTKIKLNADMTKSMASQFQTIQKEAQSLKTSLENTLKNSNLTQNQKTQLESLKTTILDIQATPINLRSEDAESKIGNIKSTLENVKSKFSSLKLDIKVNDNIRNATKTVDDFINKIKTAQNAKTGTNSFIDESKLNKVLQDAEKLKTNLSNIDMNGNVENELTKILFNLDKCKNDFKQLQNSAKISMKVDSNISTETKQIDTMLNKLKEMKTYRTGANAYIDISKINESISKLEQYKNELKNLDVNDEKVVGEFENIKTKINETTEKIKEFQNQAKQKMNMESNSASIEALKIKIDKLRDAEKLTAEQAQILKQKLEQIAQLDTGKQVNAMKNLRNEITRVTKQAEKMQTGVKRTNTFFSNLYSTMSTFSLGNIISMQITKAIYGISDTIRELDKAFVGLAKVAPDSFHNTTEELENVRQKAVEVGQDVARSATDIINSTASALQLGVSNIDRAMEYAKNVNLYANVAETTFCLCS